jgi:hypothetical protein
MQRALFAFFFLAGVAGYSATFTVINTNDSGPGSLRDSILAANTTPGANTIAFSIPGTDVQTIAPLTALPTITNTLTVDGYTQSGSRPNTLTNGNNAVLLIRLDGRSAVSPLLALGGSGHLVRGLILVRANGDCLTLSCNNSTIAGNWIGLDADNLASGNGGYGVYLNGMSGPCQGNLIGGYTPAARNVISGNSYNIRVAFPNAAFNTIAGNFIGTDAAGALTRGSTFGGIYVFVGVSNIIGGASAGSRNVISGNGPFSGAAGVALQGATGTRVQGNYIGTDATGAFDLGNGAEGVNLNSTSFAVVTGNLIANNRGNGISIGGDTNTVMGNTIGVDFSGQLALGNYSSGVNISSGRGNIIGSATPGAGNIIRFSYSTGVTLSGSATNTQVRGNILGDNRRLAIDLGGDGPTSNHTGTTNGPNGLQNYPVITSAVIQGGTVQISGTLDSAPSASFTLDFYAASGPTLLGLVQAQVYLGATGVFTDPSGHCGFSVALPANLSPWWQLSATATDASGNTSELSPIPASALLQPPSLAVSAPGDNGSAISWPSSAGSGPTPYHLETTFSLVEPVNWTPITDGIQDDGVTRSYTVQPGGVISNQFFRLKQ